MDFMAGLRLRPGANPRRYLALRGGVELFRSNEVIERNQRAFVGPVAAAAIEQYAFGAFMFNVDVRYGLIGAGPAEIALFAGVSISVR
jgi:methyl coenzyme M reductase beta subunit